MAQDDTAVRDGRAETTGGSAALRVASRGLRTMRDMANFTIAHSLDILRGRLGVREANTSLRGVSETRKLIVDGQRVGYEKGMIDAPGVTAADTDALLAEERALAARLEEIREQRAAQS